MSEAEVYYRVHWNWDSVPFDAGHAYSYLGGLEPLKDDITRYECVACDGTGESSGPDGFGSCPSCDGEGSREADRGYSCCTSPEDLMASARQMAWGSEPLAAARVVIFEGEQAGYGQDGEPLVIPSRTVQVMTWGEFTAERP